MKNCLIVLAVLVFSTCAYAGEVMKFGFSEIFPPYSWEENGKIKGILIDIADEAILKRMGIPVEHHIYPWERAQHLVKQGELDALITNGILREEWAEHSKEIVMDMTWGIYVRAGNPKLEQMRKAKSLEELKPFQFISHIGAGWDKANLVDKGFDVYMVPNQRTIYNVLAKGRADININAIHVARYHIKNLGLQDQIVELPGVTGEILFIW